MDAAVAYENIWTAWLSNDSVLQPAWDHLRLHHSHLLRSPHFPIVLTASFYFCVCVPYIIFDLMGERWPAVRRFKIQPSRSPTTAMLMRCLGVTLRNHALAVLPATLAQWAWRPLVPLPERAPALSELAGGVTANLLLFDFQYFVWHLVHHRVRWLYVTFHAIHHDYDAPFAPATQCMGGWELLTVGIWTTLNPILLRCHVLTAWAFMLTQIYVLVQNHCGYDFPWSMSRLVPFGTYGGPSMHDVHHQRPSTTFAPHFSHWDKLFGTHADFCFSKGRSGEVKTGDCHSNRGQPVNASQNDGMET